MKQIITSQECIEIKRYFAECKRVAIVCHQSPDGDAMGSSLGLMEYLTRLGKSVSVIVPNYFPDFFQWMHKADEVVNFEREKSHAYTILHHVDLICVLDLNVLSRMGEELGKAVGQMKCRKLLIDHHIGPEVSAFNLVISRPDASSTCELLFRTLSAIGGIDKLPLHGAEDIYTGMYTDTGGFSYNSNDPDIFMILAELLRKGINKDLIIRRLCNNYTADRFRLMGYVLSQKLEVFPDLHASVFSLTRDELQRFNFLKGDMEGVVNMPLQIRGHKLSISLREDTEKPVIWISIRSYDDISAKDLAATFFNGGGHFNAAGGRLENMSMDDALDIARKAINSIAEQLKAE